MQRIAVLRALRLGDLLCAIPALRVIRAAHPKASITLIGLPWARELPERYPTLIDDHLVFPGFPGIPEAPFDAGRTIAFLAAHVGRFDVAIQLHGSGTWTNAFAALLAARTTVGFVEDPTETAPGPGRWVPYPADGHEIHRLLRLTEAVPGTTESVDEPRRRAIGVALADDRLDVPVHDDDRGALAAALPVGTRLDPGSYVVVHPGASDPARRWPIEWFARIVRVLECDGMRTVVTGSIDEAPLAADVARLARGSIVDLTGRTGLGALGALVDDARLVVTNDTGISHVAAARRTPSVVVFTGSDPRRWAPLDRALHRAVGPAAAGAGSAFVTPGEVIDAVRHQLATANPTAA